MAKMNWLNLIEENWMLKAGKLKSKKNYKKKQKLHVVWPLLVMQWNAIST